MDPEETSKEYSTAKEADPDHVSISDIELPSDPHPEGELCFPRKDYLYKILVVGEFGVGKTSIIRRYTEGIYNTSYKVTIGVDFALKILDWNRRTRVSLQLWDIAGHERFGHMTSIYYKHAMGAVLVYDVTRPATFDALYKWLHDLHSKAMFTENVPLPCILLANKCDTDGPEIDTMALNEFCREAGILAWFPTSAKDNINIDESMDYLAHHIMSLTVSENPDTMAYTSLRDMFRVPEVHGVPGAYTNNSAGIVVTSQGETQKGCCK